MSIQIVKAKAQITIQDAGRWGYQSSGVPISGPMDERALHLANLIVGNKINDACLEVGMGSMEFRASKGTLISVTGNGHKLFINGIEASFNKPILFHNECLVKLLSKPTGFWSYISIGGEILINKVLGSKSTYIQSGFGGHKGRLLIVGDVLEINGNLSKFAKASIKGLSQSKNDFAVANWSVANNYPDNVPIRIVKGSEWNWLWESQQRKMGEQSFTVTADSNRMGYRLRGEPISKAVNEELISSGVTRGTVQLTNDGSLIVLMADSQTVGGYPRIAQVAAVDIPVLAHKRPGMEVRFSLISHDEAEILFLKYSEDLKKIEAGLRLRAL